MQNKKKLVSRVLLLMMVDAMIITIAGPLAIYLRYNFLWEAQAIVFIENIFQYLPLNFLLSITIFWMCRLYQGIWKYASASDLANILLGCFLSALTQLIGMDFHFREVIRLCILQSCRQELQRFVLLIGFLDISSPEEKEC